MADPRAANCRAYAETNGLVTGIELVYVAMPETRFELIDVHMIDEAQQGIGGPTSAWFNVLDKNSDPLFGEKVYLAWPWPILNGQGSPLLPGTPGEHMISGLPFNPPDIGPGEIHIADAAGNLISDRIGGIGLPYRHHVSFQLTFKERGGDSGNGDPGDATVDLTEITALLRDIKAALIEGFRLIR